MKEKRGLSPVIATVLLIAIVIIIGLILFLWFRGIAKESITKFGGENIELVCDRVDFNAEYDLGTLYFSNIGNVPIYGLNLEIYKDKGHKSYSVRDLVPNWPANGLSQGQTFSGDIASVASGAEKIRVIPILIGESNEGQKTYQCSDSSSVREI